MPRTPTRRDRPVEERGANTHTEAAVGQILEFDALLLPDLFDRALGCAPRFGVALSRCSIQLGYATTVKSMTYKTERHNPPTDF